MRGYLFIARKIPSPYFPSSIVSLYTIWSQYSWFPFVSSLEKIILDFDPLLKVKGVCGMCK